LKVLRGVKSLKGKARRVASRKEYFDLGFLSLSGVALLEVGFGGKLG